MSLYPDRDSLIKGRYVENGNKNSIFPGSPIFEDWKKFAGNDKFLFFSSTCISYTQLRWSFKDLHLRRIFCDILGGGNERFTSDSLTFWAFRGDRTHWEI